MKLNMFIINLKSISSPSIKSFSKGFSIKFILSNVFINTLIIKLNHFFFPA
jgi:hypothetical protein